MDELVTMAAACVFILITIIFCIIINKISDFFFNEKEKTFSNKHAEYIVFCEKYNDLHNELCALRSQISKYKKTVDHCLEEMKYYPQYSEYYQYYESKLNVTRDMIHRGREANEIKEQEIYDFVKNNKSVIESIKDDRKELYKNWHDRYDLG
jgi:archaellum component FlaC